MTAFKRGKKTELHKTGPPPKCHDCDRLLPSSVARVQTEGVWCCPDCALQRERGVELSRIARQRLELRRKRCPNGQQVPRWTTLPTRTTAQRGGTIKRGCT